MILFYLNIKPLVKEVDPDVDSDVDSDVDIDLRYDLEINEIRESTSLSRSVRDFPIKSNSLSKRNNVHWKAVDIVRDFVIEVHKKK